MKDDNINNNNFESIVNNFKVNGFEFESPKINLDINSLSKEEIFEKMNEIIKSREKQIRDLSVIVGNFNEKLHMTLEKNTKLEEENKLLNEKILRKDTMLNQELTNKEIMFIRLSNLEQDYEKLLSQVQNKKTINEKKSFFSSFFSSSKNDNTLDSNLNRNIRTESFLSQNITSENKMVNSDSNFQPVTIHEVKDQRYQSSNKIDINISINPNNNLTNEINNNVNPIVSQKDISKPISTKTNIDKKKISNSKRLASDQIDYKPVFS